MRNGGRAVVQEPGRWISEMAGKRRSGGISPYSLGKYSLLSLSLTLPLEWDRCDGRTRGEWNEAGEVSAVLGDDGDAVLSGLEILGVGSTDPGVVLGARDPLLTREVVVVWVTEESVEARRLFTVIEARAERVVVPVWFVSFLKCVL